ncbi:Peroxisome proliferation transcriptional regulator [Paramyrothecium foliicola]|nr:Peroxisome proliferation transcriptional regulator [Paramyrothecium foliicola]
MRDSAFEQGHMANRRAIAPRPAGASRIRDEGSAAARRARRQHPQVKLACNPCRIKKSKCDAIRPTCGQCMNRNRTCEYDAPPGQSRAEAVSDRLRADKASLMEMFWRLQTTSADEAQEFLDFIRSAGPIDMPVLEQWFSQRQTSSDLEERSATSKEETSQSSSMSHLSHAESEDSANLDVVKSQQTPTLTPDMSQLSATPKHWADSLQVSTIKDSVSMFLRSAGMLFHVFTKKQVDALFEEVLPAEQYPGNLSFLDVLREETNAQHHAQLAELCGMAAVGTLYCRLPGNGAGPPAEVAEFLYSLTKVMLDNSIEANPLRAMKVCALLTIYNIVLKATVAFTYIELGLGLGRMHGLNSADCPPKLTQEEFVDYKRVLRTLVLFSGWLSASLGHSSGQDHQDYHLPQEDNAVLTGYVIEGQLVKATMIKAAIIRKMGDNCMADDSTIETFRNALRTFHHELPLTVTIDTLFDVQRPDALRPSIFYLHLFYLSAMQLLHRRIMANQLECTNSEPAKEAVREGLLAAKMTARLLALMRLEGAVVQLCWMCIFTSYSSATIILRAAVHKILNGFPSTTWASDLKLVDVCIESLRFCSQVDSIACGFEKRISTYRVIVQDAIAGEEIGDLPEYTEDITPVDYLFHTPKGSTDLHRAARDLLHLVQKPFSNSLELIADTVRSNLETHSTLVNWTEAAVGSTHEWTWELQQCQISVATPANSAKCEYLTIEILSKLKPGRVTSLGDLPWATWTPPPF